MPRSQSSGPAGRRATIASTRARTRGHVDASPAPARRRRSRRRGGRGARRRRWRPASWSGVQPVLTQVPPRWWRSTSATVMPAPASRTASDGPAWPAPMTMASKRSLMPAQPRPGRAATATASSRRAAGRSRPKRGGEPGARLGAAERADHRADEAGDQPDGPAAAGSAERRAAEAARDERGRRTAAAPCGAAWSAAGR